MNTTHDLSGWRVLVVDDDPDNLVLIGDLLEVFGATVTKLKDGQSVLDLVDEFAPTVILLDLAMPNIDGWELHKRLRAKANLDGVPIIALTALAMPTDVERVLAVGFTAYISKPFRVQGLLDELTHCVEIFNQNNLKAGVKEHEDD